MNEQRRIKAIGNSSQEHKQLQRDNWSAILYLHNPDD